MKRILPVLLVFVVLAGAGLGVFLYLKINQKSQEDNGKITQKTALPKDKLVFLDKQTNTLNVYSSGMKKEQELYQLNSSDNILEVKYFPLTQKIAVLLKDQSGDKYTNSLVLIDIKNNEKRTIVSTEYYYDSGGIITDKDGHLGTILSSIGELSEDGNVLTYYYQGWEWCADAIYFADINKNYIFDWCGAIALSPELKTIVHFTAPGIGTGPSFGFMNIEEFKNKLLDDEKFAITDFDWSQASGDLEDILSLESSQQKTINDKFSGIDYLWFKKENTVVFNASNFGSNKESVYEMDLESKAVKKLTDIKSTALSQVVYYKNSNNLASFSYLDGYVYLINLDKGLESKINVTNFLEDKGYGLKLNSTSDNLVVFSRSQYDEQDNLTQMNYYYFDLVNQIAGPLLSNKNYLFAGFVQ